MDEDLASRPHNDQADCDEDYLHWKPDDVNRLDDDLSISQAVSQPSDIRESLPCNIAASNATSETSIAMESSFIEPESSASGILALAQDE